MYDGQVPPRRADAPSRADLVDAAVRMLAADGPGGLTLRRLAESAGTSTMAIYTHFGGMPELRRALRHHGYEGPSPLDRVRPPKARPVPRRDYTLDEAEAILDAARRGSEGGTKKGQFDYAVMATFRYTGVRRGELVDARLKDLDLAHRELTVLGKGRKRRTIPLPHAYCDVMDWYLEEVRPRLPESEMLFANPRANLDGRFRGGTDGQTLQRMTVRYGEEAGVAGPHLPHRWRHTYATHLLRKGVDVAVVQKLLGHSTITTTSIYLHLIRDDLQAGVDQAFG